MIDKSRLLLIQDCDLLEFAYIFHSTRPFSCERRICKCGNRSNSCFVPPLTCKNIRSIAMIYHFPNVLHFSRQATVFTLKITTYLAKRLETIWHHCDFGNQSFTRVFVVNKKRRIGPNFIQRSFINVHNNICQ